MNKNPNMQDDILANDEEVTKMKGEYDKVLRRDNLINLIPKVNSNNVRKYSICTCNFDNIARTYFLEKDIMTSLHFLHQKARQKSTRCTIMNILKIKERNLERLLEIYVKGTSSTMNYAPNIVDRPSYNQLFQEIMYMQSTLLSRLEDMRVFYQILCHEHTATLMLYSIKP